MILHCEECDQDVKITRADLARKLYQVVSNKINQNLVLGSKETLSEWFFLVAFVLGETGYEESQAIFKKKEIANVIKHLPKLYKIAFAELCSYMSDEVEEALVLEE